MRSFSKNKYLDALIKTILVSALFHLTLLVIFSIKTNNIEVLNIFNIIGLGLFLDWLNKGIDLLIYSFIFIGLIYLSILIFFSKHK